MAGATTALALDTLGSATNPALMAHVGHRIDLELQLFSPMREAQTGFLGGALAATGEPAFASRSKETLFFIPAFGYTRPLDDGRTVLGLSVYGNGGMNTNFALEHRDPFFSTVNQGIPCSSANTNLLGGCSDLGVDFAQLVFAPTVALELTERHSFGAAVLIGYQQFEARGLHAFQALSSEPNRVSNRGRDDAFGVGVRLGWLTKLTPGLSLGAAYSSKIYMDEFEEYRGLLAEQGSLDIPANASVGIAFTPRDRVDITVDVQWIGYSDVRSIGNAGPPLTGPSPFPDGAFSAATSSNALGRSGGLGFGWDDMVILKLGVQYQPNAQWVLRGGVSHGDQPIPSDQLAFNTIATAVPETHLTFGFSFRPDQHREWTLSYMHAFQNREQGAFPEAFCTQGSAPCPFRSEIEMNQNAISIAHSWEL